MESFKKEVYECDNEDIEEIKKCVLVYVNNRNLDSKIYYLDIYLVYDYKEKLECDKYIKGTHQEKLIMKCKLDLLRLLQWLKMVYFSIGYKLDYYYEIEKDLNYRNY